MRIKLKDYQKIYDSIRSRDDVYELAMKGMKQETPISYNTLLAIYTQKYQEFTRKTHYKHHKKDIMMEYFDRYVKESLAGEEHALLRLAEDINLAPCLVARIILQCYLLSSIFKNTEVSEVTLKNEVNKLMRDTSCIQEPHLKSEVEECIECDDVYSPLVDRIRRSIGIEYELLLYEKLTNNNIPFMTEEQLRNLGYAKTPDVKLEVPIAVDGHIVNWIESKALFGDAYNHAKYLHDQYWSYHNRYGPGMIIYWFGFIDELDCHRDEGILLYDSFPNRLFSIIN